jgi:hypothetical protein
LTRFSGVSQNYFCDLHHISGGFSNRLKSDISDTGPPLSGVSQILSSRHAEQLCELSHQPFFTASKNRGRENLGLSFAK